MARANLLAVVGVFAVGIVACSSPADQPDSASEGLAATTNVEPTDSASQVEPSADASPAPDSVTTTTELAVVEVEVPPFIPHPEPADIQRCEVPQPGWAKVQGGNTQFFSQVGFPVDQPNLTSLGELNVAAIPVDFESAPGAEDDLETFANQLDRLAQFFATVSGGRLTVNVDMTSTWQRLRGAPADFAQEQFVGPNSQLVQAALDSVDDRVDFSATDLVILTLPPEVTVPASGGADMVWIESAMTEGHSVVPVADGVDVANYVLAGPQYWQMESAWKLFATRASLMMGLPELYGGSLDDVVGLQDEPDQTGPPPSPFLNWSLLSNERGISENLPAWSRWTMGWLDPSEVLCFDFDDLVGQTFDVELGSFDSDHDGYKALIVRTGPEAALIFESRRPEGLDEGLRQWARSGRDPSGVLGYTLDTLEVSRRGPLTPVIPAGRGLASVGGVQTVDALLNEGDQVTFGSASFTLLESGDTDRLRIATSTASDAVTSTTYPLPSGQYEASLLPAPSEADDDVCRIPQAPGVWSPPAGPTGFPVEFVNLRPDGEVNIVTIPLDWNDYEADPAALDAAHEEVSLSLDYFERVSEGKLTFNRDYRMKWFRLPEPISQYAQDSVSSFNPKLAQAGIDVADPEVDFSNVDMVLFIFPRSAPIPAGRPQSPYEFAALQHFLVPPLVFVTSDEGPINNYFGGGVAHENPRNPLWSYYNHELSHAFQTPDWYVRAGQALYGPTDPSADPSVRIGPLGTWGTMSSNGGISKIFVAWTRILMGWLEQDQIECYSLDQLAEAGPFDVELTPLEIYEPGTKAVVIRTGQYSGVLIESRRPIFPDHGLAIWETVGRDPYGLIAYEIDTTIEHGEGALTLIQPDGQDLAAIEWHGRHPKESRDALFNVGAVGSSQGVEIELLHSGDRDIVRIGPAPQD